MNKNLSAMLLVLSSCSPDPYQALPPSQDMAGYVQAAAPAPRAFKVSAAGQRPFVPTPAAILGLVLQGSADVEAVPAADIYLEGDVLTEVPPMTAGRTGVLGCAVGPGTIVAVVGGAEVGRLQVAVRLATAAYASCPEPQGGGTVAGWVTLDVVGRLPWGLQPTANDDGVVLGKCPTAGPAGAGECYLFQRPSALPALFYVQPGNGLLQVVFSTEGDTTLGK